MTEDVKLIRRTEGERQAYLQGYEAASRRAERAAEAAVPVDDDRQVHRHVIEYPSRCTGCEHLAASFVQNAPKWMLAAVPVDDDLRAALGALVQDYRNEAIVIHYSREGGFHEGPEWRTCISVQCVRMRAAIEKAEAALSTKEPGER